MPDKPNIVLVTVDSLRADYVYGDSADTPVHDFLADDGIVYENAFSQGPFTTFSMPSLFTSRYPSGLQYLEFSDSTVGVYIDDEPTLPEALHEQGYETAGFHSNPLLSNLFGFDRGFDTFDARLPLSGFDYFSGQAKILTDKLLRMIRKHAYLPAEKLNARAFDWLDARDGDQPFFLWLHYMDVHGPYQAKSGNTYLNKYRGERVWRKAVKRPNEVTTAEHERLQELYRTEVEYTDHCLGNLFDGLRDRECFDDTVAVLTSDHGEQFREHGKYSHPHHLYEELTHVPLIVRDPNRESNREDEVTELIDIAPTLVDRVGGTVPSSFSGRSLFDAPIDDRAAFSEADLTPNYNGSIRTDRWRYIFDDTRDKELLFDHETDSDEQQNVIGDNSDVAERLAGRLQEHTSSEGRSVGRGRDVTKKEIEDGEVQDRLKDLGYLD